MPDTHPKTRGTSPNDAQAAIGSLADVFSINGRFVRSVNLERDIDAPSALDGYICSATAAVAVQRLVTALSNDLPTRAWTLVGPYGGGKSSFALFLSRLLAEPRAGSSAVKILKQRDANLAQRVVKLGVPYRPVLVTGRREPLSNALLRGLADLRGDELPRSFVRKLRAYHADDRADEIVPGNQVLRLYRDAVEHLRKTGTGMLLVVDELGKILEYAANHPRHGDIHLLQEIAEMANRHDEAGFLVATILHQNIDAYARNLPEAQRNEWTKVQGRYEDIAFIESREQLVELIGRSIHRTQDFPSSIDKVAKSLATATFGFAKETAQDPNRLVDLAAATIPLHPLSSLILPSLFKRIGQNQRSLFSYLASNEPGGFLDHLAITDIEAKDPVVRLHHLYDYVNGCLAPSLFGSTLRVWSQIDDALERSGDCSELEINIIKSIGVLMLAGEAGPYRPSKATIAFALSGLAADTKVDRALSGLVRRSILIYRKYRDAYAVWEGSDLDLDELLAEGRDRVHYYDALRAFLNEERFLRPVTARAHWMRTGTLRYFDVRAVEYRELGNLPQQPSGRAAGTIVYVLYEHPHQAQAVEEQLRNGLLRDAGNVIVAVPADTGVLRECIHEYECLKWVLHHARDLDADPIAKRELRNRLGGAEIRLRTAIDNCFGTGTQANACSYWIGAERVPISGYRELLATVSGLCDRAFHHTPIIRNEIANREKLSAAARKARNILIEGMIERRDREALGIEGYPPEKSIYFSLLLKTTLHRDGPSGLGFYPPTVGTDAGMRAVWEAIEAFLTSTEAGRRSLSELIGLLRTPPFGLTMGVIPVFLCAALCYFDTEIALYEDGVFQPTLTSALFEKVTINPARFTVRRCRIAGPRSKIFTRLAEIVGVPEDRTVDQAPLTVLRPLLRMVSRLPEYARRTNTLTQRARRVRDAIARASEPDVLLFTNLPQACDMPPVTADGGMSKAEIESFVSEIRRSLQEIESAYTQLLERIEHAVMNVFGAGHDFEAGRIAIAKRARDVAQFAIEGKLKDFALRLANSELPRDPWIESIGSLLVPRKCQAWFDSDIEIFEVALAELHRLFEHREVILFERKADPSAQGDAIRIAITTLRDAEIERVVLVDDGEKEQVAGLEAELRRLLKAAGMDHNPRLALAALSGVARELLD